MAAALAIPGVTPAESRLRATCLTPGSVTDLVDVGEKIGTGGFSVPESLGFAIDQQGGGR